MNPLKEQERDAERYRWLRSEYVKGTVRITVVFDEDTVESEFTVSGLDAIIDEGIALRAFGRAL